MVIFDLISPYITDIVQSLIGLVAIIIIALLAELRNRVLKWIDTRNNANQRELLHYIANEAFALVEQTMKNETSQTKLNKAIEYASARLKQYGINVTVDEVRAAIEKAIVEYNSKTKS